MSRLTANPAAPGAPCASPTPSRCPTPVWSSVIALWLSAFVAHGQTADETPPQLFISEPFIGTIVRSNTVAINGIASDDVGVTSVYVRAGVNPWELASGTQAWSAYPVLSPGANRVEVYAVDAAGNQSAVAWLTVNYIPPDYAPPGISISVPVNDGLVVNNATLAVSGTASDNVGVTAVWVRLNTNGWQMPTQVGGWPQSSTWGVDLNLAQGSNVIEAYARDADGNTSTVARRTVTYLPVNPLTVTSITRSDSDVSIGFRTLAGKTYRVMSSTTMQSGSWTTVSGHTAIAGSGDVVSRTLGGLGIPPPGGSRYFRVEEE